nr:glycosyltransferase [Cytophagales bacterium]
MDQVERHVGKRIVHLQFGSSPSGNYTIRLHEAFLKLGFDSYVLSLNSNVIGNPRIVSLGAIPKNVRKVNQKVQDFVTRNKASDSGAFSLSLFGTDISKHEFIQKAEVIYVHWILGGFLSVKNLKQLAALGKPMVMIMHDMWSMTGGCSYSFDCEKFITQCNNCPIIASGKERDISYRQYNEKVDFYAKFDNLYFVSPSYWLADLAKSARITRDKPIFRIPNPLDAGLFKPFDKKIAKGILELDKFDHVISFGANKVHSPYKGWAYLREAMVRLKDKMSESNIGVLIFGSVPTKEIVDAIPFPAKFMGFVTDDYTTNLIYNASDVFLAPSLADNLPTTIIESLSCGTPVVGFKTGGIPEMIDHKKNGYLAEYKNADDFCEGISYCLNNKVTAGLLPAFHFDDIMGKHMELLTYARVI